MILINLFIAFFKTGLLSFGGGYAMISTLCAETVKNNWIDELFKADYKCTLK